MARYTSAAPVFFRECDNYIDGGVVANNPCNFALTHIKQYLRNTKEEQKKRCVRNLSLQGLIHTSYAHICTHTHTLTRTHTHYTHICTTHIRTQTLIRTHTHHTHIRTTHTYTHTRVHTHIHHTYTRTLSTQ